MKIFFISIVLFIGFNLHAQTSSLLVDRLCQSWKLLKMEENGTVKTSDPTLNDYRIIFKNDMSVMQGLQPDGFISGTWKLDEPNMSISITDKQTKVIYTVKIIKITTDELILQDLQENNSVMMYYIKSL